MPLGSISLPVVVNVTPLCSSDDNLTRRTMMPAITNRLPAVTVEYDFGKTGKRVKKKFDDANKAKTFYAKKLNGGKKPKLIDPETSPTEKPVVEKTVAKKTPAAQAKPSAASKPDAAPKAPGVSYKQTRPYFAGVVVKRHGVAAGVTAAMVAELDELYGKANPAESKFCLKNAWHAVRGYQD